jgi:hypothetical protein
MPASLVGCDFSSSPTRRKPIVLAHGHVVQGRVQLTGLERLDSLVAFAAWLKVPREWVGGFDLPFGLPRELVLALGWPLQWEPCIGHYASLSRAQIRAHFAAFCDARPPGSKFAHRATDLVARSSPSMKWVNPPVAYMLHAGVPLLLDAGVYFPGLHSDSTQNLTAQTLPRKVALEAYPGMLAREVLGARSYKSDDKAKHTPERLIARKDLVHALEMGHNTLQLRVKLTHAQRDVLVDDGSGDALDAVLCLVQTAWGFQQHQLGVPRYGLPMDMDPLEGWIVSAKGVLATKP